MLKTEEIAAEILRNVGFRNPQKVRTTKPGEPDFRATASDGSICLIEVKSTRDEILKGDNRPTATLKRHQMRALAKNMARGGRSFVLYCDRRGRYFLFELISARRRRGPDMLETTIPHKRPSRDVTMTRRSPSPR